MVAIMSQSSSGGLTSAHQAPPQEQRQQECSENDQLLNPSVHESESLTANPISGQNGRAEAVTSTDDPNFVKSNESELRTIDYEKFGTNEPKQSNTAQFQGQQSRPPVQYVTDKNDPQPEHPGMIAQPIQYTILKHPPTTDQPEDCHPLIERLLENQYQANKLLDIVQQVSQTSTQTLPVQSQPHLVMDCLANMAPQYAQIRAGQCEVRSRIYPEQQQQPTREYGDRAGYVTRDVIAFREQSGSALYTQAQSSSNAMFYGTSPYVTVQHAECHLPSQSKSPQPPYYTAVPMEPQTGYSQFPTGQLQYPYNQYTQTVINPVIYNPHGSVYQPQLHNQQSTNLYRYSQDVPEYQAHPVNQPSAQDLLTGTEKTGGRGPKPMVPPRGNSRITHADPNNRKSASVDVPALKTTTPPPKYELFTKSNPLASQEQINQSGSTLLIAGTKIASDDAERRFLSPINQNPRTRQDGLYVAAHTDQTVREKTINTMASDCELYVLRSHHRKSISADVTTSFHRRNNALTFSFPGDNSHQDTTMPGHKAVSLGDRNQPENSQVFPFDTRRVEPTIPATPMIFDPRQENSKNIIPERKPEWGDVSPIQRHGSKSAQENRRSDYFEEHRRSPMNLESKRLEDVRRSPMSYVLIRDPAKDRTTQKSASFGNQIFEKTRQELAMWAEQRARQDMERGIHPGQIFSTSPRTRNQSEGGRDPRTILPDEKSSRDPRSTPTNFQPICHISQSSIISQRGHLRRVSADLTKDIQLSKKDFDDQPITGSVANLVQTIPNPVFSQKASQNIAHQFPAQNQAKLDSKTLPLTVVTDCSDHVKPIAEQSDHIIHSHRKSHNNTTNLLTHSKSQADNLHGQTDQHTKKIDTLQVKQQLQNQQSLDMISERLSKFERQQSDLQAKLQCLQNQNQILDKVAQFQQHQNNIQVRLQCFQDKQTSDETSKQSEYQSKSIVNDLHQVQLSPLSEQIIQNFTEKTMIVHDQQQTQGSQRQSGYGVPPHVSAQICETQICQSIAGEGFSPRLPLAKLEDSSTVGGQMTVPEFESNASACGSVSYRLPCTSEIHDNRVILAPQLSSSSTMDKGLAFGSVTYTGTLKKVPPEKPPRTSLIIQSSEPETLVYHDGNLVSGSLEALVQHMVPTEEYYPDRAYLFAFLLSARLFIKPHELLGEVCTLCEHQQNLNGEDGKERLHRFVPRLVQLLAEWTETFPYDFRDERVMAHVKSITQKLAAVDAAARQEVSALLQNLLLRLTALERYEEALARLTTEAATDQLSQVDLTELCPSPTALAQQLTHVELERLSYIGPEEFVQAFAKESPHLETSFKDMKKTRNLESYVQWFNRLSYLIATETCKHAKKKQRVRVVEYWIETARECFNIGNFNSLMAIIAGLNMSPISRLKKTWSKVQTAKFAILEHQMDPSSNFSNYRSTLKAAMWRSTRAIDERQRIVVPFFSLLVKDLYFLNEGCSNKLPNGHINFEKFWQLAKQVTEFISWKQVACPFEKNPRVIAFLQTSPVLTETALALASFECEPPDSNSEKDRYKALKSGLNTQ